MKPWESSTRDRRYKNPCLFRSEKDNRDDDDDGGDEMKMMVMVG